MIGSSAQLTQRVLGLAQSVLGREGANELGARLGRGTAGTLALKVASTWMYLSSPQFQPFTKEAFAEHFRRIVEEDTGLRV